MLLIGIIGCVSEVDENMRSDAKVAKKDTIPIDQITSGLFLLEEGHDAVYFSLHHYYNATSFYTYPDSNAKVYYELSAPDYCSSYNSYPCYKYACGRLYTNYRIKNKQGHIEKKLLIRDSTLYFTDSNNDKWVTYYVSDTTNVYGYFYVQRRLGHPIKNLSDFKNKVRIVAGNKQYSTKLDFNGEYKRLHRTPYRRIGEKDIKEEE
ncbi:MAG: hypothetical protein SFU27_00180 [Thermonemataceae bacterium]|nr:hypothetical protein [Thermonemataceae bacterium]